MRLVCTVCGLVVFILSLIAAYIFAPKAPGVAATAIGAGLMVAILLFFLPLLWRRLDQGGGLTVGVSGFKIPPLDFTVRSREPLVTYSPPSPTDSTTNPHAKTLCDAGREIVFPKPGASNLTSGREVDLNKALEYFRQAAELDPNYWEARLNIAQVMLIKQDLPAALALASDVRVRFFSDPLAFARATLIIAKVLEMRIPPQVLKEQLRNYYEPILRLLRESLLRCPKHMVTRTSLGKALIKSQANAEEKLSFLRDNLDDLEFKKRFKEALMADHDPLLDAFEEEFPGLLNEQAKGGSL
jgi:tetratricopeptide (TPR) repeat protein